MSDETHFVDGMIVKKKRENAPDFVKCHFSFKVSEMIATLQKYEKKGWVNADMLLSKGGKLYCKIDTFQPTQGEHAEQGIVEVNKALNTPQPEAYDPNKPFEDSDVPF